VVKVVTRAQSQQVTDLWHLANDHQRAQLSLPMSQRADEVLARDGAFAVGVFDDDVLISVAAAFPARQDDGRSTHNVAGLAHISSVATRPERWREGLAQRTLTAIVSQARRRGYARVQLFTYASNGPALRLYAREGFVNSGRTRLDQSGEGHVHLLCDIPALPPVNRSAARVLCQDPAGRILLMHWRDPIDGHRVWEPPGGGIEADEDPERAVRREWYEETGFDGLKLVGEPTQVSRDTFWNGTRVVADEWYFAGRIAAAAEPEPAEFTAGEQEQTLGWGWFTMAEMAALEDEVVPDLVPVVQRLSG
jgi:8-oxo-dGTP pyrophosphatase MutT (NUDIX family)/GNAT superfamily N-acetyltransferase